MKYKIIAKTDKGLEALKRYFKDSQCRAGRAIAKTTMEGDTVTVKVRALIGMPSFIQGQAATLNVVKEAIKPAFIEYGVSEADYEVVLL